MSNIQWTDETWNPVSGCTRVSAGCDNCYAVAMTHRLEAMLSDKYTGLTVINGKGDRHFNGIVRTDEVALRKPLTWRKPRKVFVNSMSDLFHDAVPFEFIDQVFAVMALTPWHTYQILTKRPERMAEYFRREYPAGHIRGAMIVHHYWHASARILNAASEYWAQRGYEEQGFIPEWPLPNVWLGTSVENQAAADERIPHLLQCPAAVRFLSCEPLLSGISIPRVWGRLSRCACGGLCDYGVECPMSYNWRSPIHWLIVGGESGPGARPCNVQWIRSLVNQCKRAEVPVFVKQLGSMPIDRNDHFENPDDPCSWPEGISSRDDYYPSHQGELCAIQLNNKKGADPNEWPEDLRVREFPSPSTKEVKQ